MDYFDNSSFLENINENSADKLTKLKKYNGWLVLACVALGCVAGLYIYKYEELKKDSKK